MNNLSRFLSEIARRLDEQAGALADDGSAAIATPGGALRDHAGRLRAVADAAHDDVTRWSRIEDEIGVDIEPEPEPLIQIHFGPGDVEEMAWGSGVPLAPAMSRALRWAPAIAASATALCASQLLSVVRTDNPWAAGATTDPRGQGSRR